MTANKLLILNCDDFGQSMAANGAIIQLLEERRVSSATIMPPAPAFAEAAEWARARPELSVGLHLTFTSEINDWRWSSLTGKPSLADESGAMYRTVLEFEKGSDPQDVKAEMIAQFRAVKDAGLQVTHVDNHMGSLYGLQTGRSYLPQTFWQCAKRGLPFRIPRRIYEKDTFLSSIPNVNGILAKIVALADTLGVRLPDYLLSHTYLMEEGETYDSFKRMLINKLYELPEGISETYIHPSLPDEEMAKRMPSYEKRVWEYRLMLEDDFAYALRDAGVKLVDYRHVREVQKKPRLPAAVSLLKGAR